MIPLAFHSFLECAQKWDSFSIVGLGSGLIGTQIWGQRHGVTPGLWGPCLIPGPPCLLLEVLYGAHRLSFLSCIDDSKM